ncbi:SDR family NAD(P)-dependent oxidoreductase [Microtetraspora sp. AC03309]|uniref:SDR family NAD(P)-dependent oxidoreductase n=1 Tax=Microtetraspora sp. AC03309 TaxID=2779376 RepID=UPI001E2C4527|nr:SDR family NAD(P)-dependent oxidoreductase [Microtetraspora sp. AC03309]MCC5577229.1 SDR family NAD(P)-dependent oxidoreductase [Microtetraspora sp. AC03309]
MNTVITGASDGIGAASALELARKGHQLILVGRTPSKLSAVADQVAAITGRRPGTLTGDFTSFEDVRWLAAELLDRCERIDVLINNAGVMSTRRQHTADGHELMIQVNHLSPFLLTNLLLDRIRESSGRVVTTCSRAAKTGRLDPADLSRERRRWSGWLQYGDSKQANALFTVSLAERGIAATCLHPGVIRTGFAPGTFLMKLVLHVPRMGESVEAGAARITHLATHRDGVDHPGRYFAGNIPVTVPVQMADPELAAALWSASLIATGSANDRSSASG